jgi:uncharacterized protein YegP (UPF0339 family)
VKIQIYRDTNDEWRWRMKAPNGEVIADSGEGYYNYADVTFIVDKIFGGRFEIEEEGR